MRTTNEQTPWVRAALKTLGIDQLVLMVFDAALPQETDWDIGVGSPYSKCSRRFFEFASELGFNGIQFGPQGAVSRDFASPYDGAAFSRNPLSIALDELTCSESLTLAAEHIDGGLLPQETVSRCLGRAPYGDPSRTAHRDAFDRQDSLLAVVTRRLQRFASLPESEPLLMQFAAWRSQNHEWLLADGLYDVLCAGHGVGDYSEFPQSGEARFDADLWHANVGAAPDPKLQVSLMGYQLESERAARLTQLAVQAAGPLEEYAWRQFLASEQHHQLRAWARERGLELYGDLHVGYSRRDQWHFRSFFLQNYLVGAPPSRTNPAGQPWGYPTLDPALFTSHGDLGPALRLLRLRASRLFSDFDHVRVDHPHGLVCPWVYSAQDPDPFHAVQNGARLFSSPHLPDHPSLARHAIVKASQLNEQLPRHADEWIRYLEPHQVRRFATCFEILTQQARTAGGSSSRLVCEVLSTLPNELRAVLQEHGLGRFRITQKAKLSDPSDVYVTDNARPEDWMLMGNHDTPTIWSAVDRWRTNGEHLEQVHYLASRLSRDENHRRQLEEQLASDPCALAHAKLADLFTSRARNVMVSFGDLFGMREPYNVPGTISDRNWSQRLPRSFAESYARRLEANEALSLPRALRLALDAQTSVPSSG